MTKQLAPTISSPAPILPPVFKAILSVLLVLHLTAVFIAPFAFACRVGPASSPLADGLMSGFRPYIDALFLNHGYFFFAPDPGPTHLVRYRLEFDDGRESIIGTFPNLAEHRPRLLYHRHFMLAEAINNAYVPSQSPPEPSPPLASATNEQRQQYEQAKRDFAEQFAFWRHRRAQYEAFRDSLAAHLKSAHQADRVTLTRVEHRNLWPNEMVQGKSLRDADTYRDLPDETSAASNR